MVVREGGGGRALEKPQHTRASSELYANFYLLAKAGKKDDDAPGVKDPPGRRESCVSAPSMCDTPSLGAFH